MIAGVTIDLSQRVARAMAYVSRWVRRSLADQVQDPHNYGRAVDALLKGAAVSDGEVEVDVIDGLRDALLACTDNPLAMPAAHDAIDPHDLREMVQSLTELAYTRGDAACQARLGVLLDTLLRLTRADGTWHQDGVAAEPALVAAGFHDGSDANASAPPRARGRTIMALTNLYRRSGDTRALELADRYVRLVRSTSFTDAGELTVHAGMHTHSITGTVHGLADFGVLAGDADTLEHARRIFDHGLAPTCSSFGWSIESLGAERIPGRGEINNTGDMLQAAILFGLAGHAEYFATAERMLRSHVLPSQWLRGQEMRAPADAPDYAITHFPDDADGGWGFPTPTDRHVPDPLFPSASILDITQGGVQCIWAALRSATSRLGMDTRLNMFVSADQDPDDMRVTPLQQGGRLWVRYPAWLPAGGLGIKTRSGANLETTRIGDWAVTGPLQTAEPVRVLVPQTPHAHQEWVYWQRYQMQFAGDTIVAMSPRGSHAPMFDELAV